MDTSDELAAIVVVLGAALLACMATTLVAYKIRLRRQRRVRASWSRQGSTAPRQ